MAQSIDKVKPGDLIKSELINAMIDNLESLTQAMSGIGGIGLIVVPNLVGRTLGEARALLSDPTAHLNLGAVFDVFGLAASAVATDAQTRLVVNQVPPSGARVAVGTALNLVLSVRQPSTTTGGDTVPSDKLVLDSIHPFTPSPVRIGDPLTISGDNFDLSRDLNEVLFDGKKADMPLSSTKKSLVVVVPNIDNPPTGPAQKEVTVLVRAKGQEASAKLNLLAKSDVPRPAITGVMTPAGNPPNTIAPGDIIKVNGNAFASSPTRNEVFLDSLKLTPRATDSTANSLSVVLPDNLATVFNMSAGDTRKIDITVRNPDTALLSTPFKGITLAIPSEG
jgi:hypothetical protein